MICILIVLKRVQPTVAIEEGYANCHGNNSNQSDSSTDSSGDHTPELLSLEDLQSNTYELTNIGTATLSSLTDDHDSPAVTMEITEAKVIATKPNTITTTTATTEAVTMSTMSHGAGVSDSGIAGFSVEMSTQLRDDYSNHLQGSGSSSCIVSEQSNIKHNRKLPSSSIALLSHNKNVTVAKNCSNGHCKEHTCHPSAADSGLGYKTVNHTHCTDENSSPALHTNLPMDDNVNSVSVSRSSSTIDSTGGGNSLRTGVLLPSKYQAQFEGSTPKSRYTTPTHSNRNDKNKWTWFPRYSSTNGESFSSLAEEVLLRKEMLKSQLQHGESASTR